MVLLVLVAVMMVPGQSSWREAQMGMEVGLGMAYVVLVLVVPVWTLWKAGWRTRACGLRTVRRSSRGGRGAGSRGRGMGAERGGTGGRRVARMWQQAGGAAGGSANARALEHARIASGSCYKLCGQL